MAILKVGDVRQGISGKVQLGIMAAIAVVFIGIFAPNLVEEVMPDELTVIQTPITGKLVWYTNPGWASQMFGNVTTYKKRSTIEFKKMTDGKSVYGGIPIRFADGGHATMYGSVQFQLPTDEANLNNIHSAYRGNDLVVANLLRTVLNKSIYLSGTLMTSRESYSEKKNDLLHYVADQMQNGVYRTRSVTKWVKDEITGQNKEITQAEILTDKNGNIERQEDSVLNKFKITAYNFTIDDMPYDEVIEAQIKQQQQITMDVQTSIAQAKKKDQDALTAEAEGRRSIAQAKAEQETIKIREVTKAEQEKQVAITAALREKEVAETAAKRQLAVAEYAKQEAEQYKAKLILEGEGEAKKKELILNADGALAQKLATYEKVAGVWANALMKFQGDITPRVVMGQSGTGTSATNAIQQFMDLQNVKAATDLGLNLDISRNSTAPSKK